MARPKRPPTSPVRLPDAVLDAAEARAVALTIETGRAYAPADVLVAGCLAGLPTVTPDHVAPRRR